MTPTTNSTEQAEGWVEHTGDSDPFASPLVEVTLRNGEVMMGYASDFFWGKSDAACGGDILTYRVVGRP